MIRHLFIIAALLAPPEPPPITIFTAAYEAGPGVVAYAVTISDETAGYADVTSNGQILNIKWGDGPCNVDGFGWHCKLVGYGGLIVYAKAPLDCAPWLTLDVTLDSGAHAVHRLPAAKARDCGTLHQIFLPMAQGG